MNEIEQIWKKIVFTRDSYAKSVLAIVKSSVCVRVSVTLLYCVITTQGKKSLH